MSRSGPITRDTSAIALGLAQIRLGPSFTNIGVVTPVLTADDSIGNLANTKYQGNVDSYILESGFPLQEDLVIPTREANSLECAFREITPKNMAIARGIDPFADISATVSEVLVDSTSGTISGTIAVEDDAGPITETWTAVVESESSGDTTYSVYGSLTGKVLDSAVDSAVGEPVNPDDGTALYFSIPVGFFDGTWAEGESYVFTTTAFHAGDTVYTNAHSGEIGLGAMLSPKYMRMEAVYTYPDGVNKMIIIFPRCNVSSSPEIDLQAEDAAAVTITISSKGASSDVDGGHSVWDSMAQGVIRWTDS